jgi:hypothetical protein
MDAFCMLDVFSFIDVANRKRSGVGNAGFAGGINWADMVSHS